MDNRTLAIRLGEMKGNGRKQKKRKINCIIKIKTLLKRIVQGLLTLGIKNDKLRCESMDNLAEQEQIPV